MNSHRLPRFLAEHVISQNVCWAEEWTILSDRLNFVPTDNNPLCSHWKTVLNLLRVKEREENVIAANNSQHHDLYPLLHYNVTPTLASNFSSRTTSLIIKARGGLLNLNAVFFRNNTSSLCTICNLGQIENTHHFIGICPIYNNIRKRCFNRINLSLDDVINILNGTNFCSLYKYIELALNYRKLILNDFGT